MRGKLIKTLKASKQNVMYVQHVDIKENLAQVNI
jgi:hypothetical protein